ncbi:MAG: NAD(P)/FAD-dependent oxidoreductase [Anaerocolumna sp.]
MIQISQLKLHIDHKEEDLKLKIIKMLKINQNDLLQYKIVKKSIEARRKKEISYVYNVEVALKGEESLRKKLESNPYVSFGERNSYDFKPTGTQTLLYPPVVVGCGPAGLFCGLMLARNGYNPILIERGDNVDDRLLKVENFWKDNVLDPESNVQFGEGGAGTFSDGKLNTMVKDPSGRNRKVLEVLVEKGAPEEILYLNKPHIGTNLLRDVVKEMREEIIRLGGQVRFRSCLTDVIIEEEQVKGIELNHGEILPCQALILAIGHSARDTFELLNAKRMKLTPKSFAIGVRIEHPQMLINQNQYGDYHNKLPAADYKLTHTASTGRSVYSFCMCPGGFVVNSSSEEGLLAVNGMSNHERDEENANSALIVTVTPNDFPVMEKDRQALGGVEFQRMWERKAYEIGKGFVPVQLFKDLCNNRDSDKIGHIKPNLKGNYTLANLNNCLPDYIIQTIMEGIKAFDKFIPGFADEEAPISGVETRTSSPIRMERDENYLSNIAGIYPCGEGAGYAGGITSAAIDGIKIFEAIGRLYGPYVK